MKKELRIFLIIAIGWLSLLNFAVVKTVLSRSIGNNNAIIINNILSGAAIYYPLDNNSLFFALILPLIIFNALVIIFLSLSYYFWMKSRNKTMRKKSIHARRGQASMEFLMTYGWAIMAFIISIAALAYFNVPFFSSTGKNYCALTQGFNCKEFIVGPEGVILVIENGMGYNLIDVTVNITNSPQGPCQESIPPKELKDGTSEKFYVPCSNIKNLGDKFRGDIVVKYRKSGTILDKTITGIIDSEVTDYEYIDLNSPIITITLPEEGITYASGSPITTTLKYNVLDESTITCNYKLDNGPEIPPEIPYTCANVETIVSTYYGLHTFTVSAADNKENQDSKSVTFSITKTGQPDITPPNFILNSPRTNPDGENIHQNDNVEFLVDWTDNVGLDRFRFYINQGSGFVGTNDIYFPNKPNTIDTSSQSIRITQISGERVYWYYVGYDTSNNSNQTDTYYFTVGGSSGGNLCIPVCTLPP